MFTGLIEDIGEIVSIRRTQDMQISIKVSAIEIKSLKIGDSIAVNGICLTVVFIDIDIKTISFDASLESISKTSLELLDIGSKVNLELALKADGRFGGHMVSGHVDTVSKLIKVSMQARSRCLWYSISSEFEHFVAPKGSISIDGVSLTVNEVADGKFSVNVIPHTWDSTIMRNYLVGQKVNIEIDLIARYLDRLVNTSGQSRNSQQLSYNHLMKL
jgi:riboflavin synthase